MFEGTRIVGVAGKALSGKDTFCKILLEELSKMGISGKRIALADALKQEIRPSLLSKYGIDILNCSPEEKEKVRPELIELGRARRVESEGTFWTKIVMDHIKESSEQFFIVPDIRYNVYPEDEAVWVHKNRGLIVHVTKYFSSNGVRYYNESNEEEAQNDPLVKNVADYVLEWEAAPYETLATKTSQLCQSIISHAIRIQAR
jgi:hypothetical protein